jgi:hypothetical protein
MFVESTNFAAGVTGAVAIVTVICGTIKEVYGLKYSHMATMLAEQLELNRQTTAAIADKFMGGKQDA